MDEASYFLIIYFHWHISHRGHKQKPTVYSVADVVMGRSGNVTFRLFQQPKAHGKNQQEYPCSFPAKWEMGPPAYRCLPLPVVLKTLLLHSFKGTPQPMNVSELVPPPWGAKGKWPQVSWKVERKGHEIIGHRDFRVFTSCLVSGQYVRNS